MTDAIISMNQFAQQQEVRKRQLEVQQKGLEIKQQEAARIQNDAAALNTAIAANTDTEGKVDWEGVQAAYSELGGTDHKGVAALAKEARGSGELVAQTIGNFNVLTQNGRYVLGSAIKEGSNTPSDIRSAQEVQEKIAEARKLFQSGTPEGIAKAKDIFQAYKVTDSLTGMIADPVEYFRGETTPPPPPAAEMTDEEKKKRERLEALRAKRGR
jgi:hypothetical protein